VMDIDVDTGVYKIRRFYALDDCGTRINPMIIEGQVHGGLTEAFAIAMGQEIRYDDEGNVLTGAIGQVRDDTLRGPLREVLSNFRTHDEVMQWKRHTLRQVMDHHPITDVYIDVRDGPTKPFNSRHAHAPRREVRQQVAVTTPEIADRRRMSPSVQCRREYVVRRPKTQMILVEGVVIISLGEHLP